MVYRKLGDYCEVKGGKRLPKGEQLVEYETNHPYLRISDYSNGSVNLNNLKYVTEETFQKISRYIINEGDIFLSIVGTIGIVDFIDYKLDSASLTENAVRIRSFNESVLSTKFLSYFLKSDQGQNEMFIRTVGSTQPKLAITRIKDINIPIIDIKSQQKISNILSTIDEKITLNKNLIANLEELSQTLFKQWFVDFEFPDENGNPYKSSGGEMIDSELGKIPKEWTVKPLNEFIDIIDNRGKTPPLVNEMRAHPIIDVKALSGDTRVIDYKKCLKFVSKETYDTWFRSGHPKKGDTLLSTVGSIGETKMFYHDIGTIAQNVVSLRSENSYYTYDLINNVKSSFLTFNIGSVQPSIKITHINKIKVVYPSKIVIENYEKMIKKFISNLYVRDLENQNLTQLRDTLLPKLMSGEIEIPDDIEVNEDELSI